MREFLLFSVGFVNLLSFFLFAFDKRRSKRKERRISEKNLLITALFGGAGAFLGMAIYRHKIRKPKFFLLVPLFLFLTIAELYLILNFA